jgi:hypothetical protein
MRKWGAVAILVLASTAIGAVTFKPNAIEHTLSIVQRPDGQFDVTCLDGVTEIKTREDVLANRLCTHLKTYDGRWTLIEGGIDNGSRFCDLDMNLIRSQNAVLKLRASFAAPCAAAPSETQQCQGLSCSLPLGGRFFNFDFSQSGKVTLTRIEDGFSAVYRGNAGAGSGAGAGTARLTEIGGEQNILQTSNDGGATFLSVCDDGFGEVEAAVACRELGFSGARQTITDEVYVSGDRAYGWDDLSCSGQEAALSECRHTSWTAHNCTDSEHVRLVCDP